MRHFTEIFLTIIVLLIGSSTFPQDIIALQSYSEYSSTESGLVHSYTSSTFIVISTSEIIVDRGLFVEYYSLVSDSECDIREGMLNCTEIQTRELSDSIILEEIETETGTREFVIQISRNVYVCKQISIK